LGKIRERLGSLKRILGPQKSKRKKGTGSSRTEKGEVRKGLLRKEEWFGGSEKGRGRQGIVMSKRRSGRERKVGTARKPVKGSGKLWT